MSKKDRLKAKEKIRKTDNVDGEQKHIKEPLSKGEKMFTWIVIAIGVVALLLIVLLSIPYGGEKEIIARRYETLTEDNVFEYIEYEELREKINNCEEFHVLFINANQTDANKYIFYTDELANDYQVEIIYLFDTSKLNDDETRYLKRNVGLNLLDGPNIVYYKKAAYNYSSDIASTCRFELSDYANNYWRLIIGYFDYCNEQ